MNELEVQNCVERYRILCRSMIESSPIATSLDTHSMSSIGGLFLNESVCALRTDASEWHVHEFRADITS